MTLEDEQALDAELKQLRQKHDEVRPPPVARDCCHHWATLAVALHVTIE
jgi:hypothetical protein